MTMWWPEGQDANGSGLTYDPTHPHAVVYQDASGLFVCTTDFAYSNGLITLGSGSVTPGLTLTSAAGLPGIVQWWHDATPTTALSVGNGVPGSTLTTDLIFASWNGSAWTERGRWVNGGTLRVASLAAGGIVDADTSGNLGLATLGAGLSFSGGTLDVANPAGGTVTLGSSTEVVKSITVDGYGKVQSATHGTATGIFSKLFFGTASATPGAGVSQWLQGTASLFPTTSFPYEFPNDFLAGHIQLRVNLMANGISAGTYSVTASRNGSGIAGTTVNYTSASITGVTVGTLLTTSSASANDTYGVFVTSSGGFSSTGVTLSVEMVLTP